VRSKADISQLNLPHGTKKIKKWKTEKVTKTDMQADTQGNPWSQSRRRKEGYGEKDL